MQARSLSRRTISESELGCFRRTTRSETADGFVFFFGTPFQGLAGCHQAVVRIAILFRFNAAQTNGHSPCTFLWPRKLKRRNPSTCLIHPNGGPASHFRLRYHRCPSSLRNRSCIACVCGFFALGIMSFPFL